MKKVKYIALALGVILTLTILIIAIEKGNIQKNDNYTVTCTIHDNNVVWEVRVQDKDGLAYLYKDGNQVELVKALKVKETKPCMTLPNISSEEGVDIEKEATIQVMTWKSNLHKSALYVKYLKESGYDIIRYAATQSYIEVYLKKNDTIKRLLILNDSIMAADVLNSNLPNIESYYK